MKYSNFDLWIEEKRDDHYPLRAETDDDSGEYEGSLILEPSSAEIVERLKILAGDETDDQFLKDFGGMLFQSLFAGSIGNLFQKSLGDVDAQNKSGNRTGLRIRLRIKPPEIAVIPWELLYEKDRDCFFATSTETPLTRYIEMPKSPNNLPATLPMQVLVVIPKSPELDTQGEKKYIVEALDDLGEAVVKYDILEKEVTPDEINRKLNKKQYNIFHFIGHGEFRNGEGHLRLDPGKDGRSRISASEFADFFKESPWFKLVILNSCKSAALSATQPLTGVAQQIVRAGNVPAVVAMQYSITDEAAKSFADDFYQRLCAGFEPGRVDGAISHARKWVKQKHGPTNSFITPVLLMRSRNGVIFDLDRSEESGRPIDSIHLLNDVAEAHQDDINIWAKRKSDPAATPEVAQEAAQKSKQARQDLANVKSRIWRLYRNVAASAAPQLAAVVFVISAIVFFAYWTKFFNIVHVDDLVQNNFVPHMNDYVAKKFSPDVRIIVADKNGNDGMGEPANNPSWRKNNATLVKALTQAGARAIVFDLTFENPSPFDQELLDAIKATSDTPTRVIAGKEYEDGKRTVNLAPEFDAALNQGWGNLLVGGLRLGVVSYYEIAALSSDQAQGEMIPSLALRTVMLSDPRVKGAVAYYNDSTDEIRFRVGDKDADIGIPVMKHGNSLDIFFDLADDQKIRSDHVRFPYKEVYDRASDLAYLKRNFENKIVLIGYERGDEVKVIGGGDRLGVEIQANVISNLLEGVYIYQLPLLANVFIIMLMVTLGVLLQTKLRRWRRFKIPIPIPGIKKDLPFPALLFIVIVIYLVVAFAFYQHILQAFDITYHIFALSLSYSMVGVFRKKLGY